MDREGFLKRSKELSESLNFEELLFVQKPHRKCQFAT